MSARTAELVVSHCGEPMMLGEIVGTTIEWSADSGRPKRGETLRYRCDACQGWFTVTVEGPA